MMISCQQCREEFAELALGQPIAAPTAATREHLAACPVCRQELAEVEEAWTALSLSLAPVSPSPQVIERLLSRIEEGTKTLRDSSQTAAGRLTRRQRVLSYVVAASVFFALCASYLWLLRPSQADVAAKRSVENLAARLGVIQQDEMERLFKSDNFRVVSLHGSETPASAQAYVVWDLAVGQWHFFADHLPQPPTGQAYQLWAQDKSGHLLPGPAFAVNAEGLGSVVADMPKLAPGSAAKAVVTLEPAGGSKQPTGKVVLEAAL